MTEGPGGGRADRPPDELRMSERAAGREVLSAGALGAALLATLFFCVGYLAVISPLPLILHRLRRGFGSVVMATLLSTAALAWIFSPERAFFFLSIVVPGLVMAEALARGRGITRGCQWAFALVAIEISLALLFAAPDISARLTGYMESLRSPTFLQELRGAGWSPDTVDVWVEQSKSLESALRIVYPAFFVVLGGLGVLVNAFLLRSYLVRRDPGWLDGGEFEEIRWPLGLAVIFVVSGLSVLFSPLRHAAYNVLLIVAFFLILQGLAVVAYYTHRLAGPRFLRTAVILLVLVNLWASAWAPPALALLGLFDIFFDFRKWAEPPQAEER
jgi:uncharacterized protein YybS (DUF2232 family)